MNDEVKSYRENLILKHYSWSFLGTGPVYQTCMHEGASLTYMTAG